MIPSPVRSMLLVAGVLLGIACKSSPPAKGNPSPTPDAVDEAIALEKECLSRASYGFVEETLTSCRRSIDLFVAAGMKADAPRLQVLRNAIASAEARARLSPIASPTLPPK